MDILRLSEMTDDAVNTPQGDDANVLMIDGYVPLGEHEKAMRDARSEYELAVNAKQAEINELRRALEDQRKSHAATIGSMQNTIDTIRRMK